MRGSISKYPVGATWECVTDMGTRGKITLEKMEDGFEFWRWTRVEFSDGSGIETDWGTSYHMCREQILIWNSSGKPIRFKRVR
jgi:hypothetical protein